MSKRKEQVERFYSELWEARDYSAIGSILHQGLSFRGSLGKHEHGHSGFLAYIEQVHAALGDYRCRIDTLIEEDERVCAQMRFSGRHQALLLGVAASGREVSWPGCAIFTFEDTLITDIWVVGDRAELFEQLQ